MTFEMYRYLSLGMAIACGIMVAVSVVLFVKLQIPKVIADLTGRTAKKAIADIRRQNEQTGDKAYKSSSVNLRRGKLTDKMSPSGRIEARHTTPFGTGVITEKIASNKNLDTEISDGNETRKYEEETAVLSSALLTGIHTETMVLQRQEAENDRRFTIEYEITYVHTNEAIS
ncbi:MAG: hypothetical protein ACI3W5_16240 [Faecousia sp.]